MTLEGWCSARNYEEMVGEAWDRLRIRTKSPGIWAPSWVLAQKTKRAKQVHSIIQSPSAFGAINVSVILHPHHPRNGQLIQPHPRALDQVPQPQIWKSETMTNLQHSSHCFLSPTVLPLSYHLASSCGGSVELAASFHVVKTVFSHLVMSGTLPTWRFSWSKPSPLWSNGWGTVGRCVQIKSITAKQQGCESSGMDSLMDSVSPQMVDELCPGNVKQCLTAL